MADELTQEDVFNDDKDPLEAIREIRKEEGIPEGDEPLESSLENDASASAAADNNEGNNDDDLGEIDPAGDGETGDAPAQKDEQDDQNAAGSEADPNQGSAEGDAEGADDQNGDGEADDGAKPEGGDKEAGEAPGPLTFKANGQEFEFTQEEIMEQFETVFGQAMNYTQKMQKIAPYRKMISALEAEGLNQDQLNIAIDALKGNKDALQQIIKAHGIEAFDLDGDAEDNTYQPTPYGKSDGQLDIDEISAKISSDKEYPITVDVIDNQWDGQSRQVFASNPNLIVGLHNDIKTGKYDEVAPVAMKMKVLDGSVKSDIEYYMLAGQQLQEQETAAAAAQQQNGQQQTTNLNQQTQDTVANNDAASSAAQRKRSASSTRTRADRQGVIDYLDDDDEKFDAWYDKLMSSQ
jgi:hypothetical protein